MVILQNFVAFSEYMNFNHKVEISSNSFLRSDPVSMLVCSTVGTVNDALLCIIVCKAALSLVSKYMHDAKALPFLFTHMHDGKLI